LRANERAYQSFDPSLFFKSKDHLDSELDFSRRRRCLGQQTCRGIERARPIEYVGVGGVGGGSKIGVVENIEDLGTELNVEPFRDPFKVVVLEHGEIE
jgi:hypothetical protein